MSLHQAEVVENSQVGPEVLGPVPFPLDFGGQVDILPTRLAVHLIVPLHPLDLRHRSVSQIAGREGEVLKMLNECELSKRSLLPPWTR